MGEWLWLAIWPLGVGLFLAVTFRLGGRQGMLMHLSAGSAVTLLASGVMLVRFLCRPVPSGGVPPASPQVRHLIVGVWSGANAALWGFVFLLFLSHDFHLHIRAMLYTVFVAFFLLWLALPARVLRDHPPVGDTPAPWTHYVGLTLASLPSLLPIMVIMN